MDFKNKVVIVTGASSGIGAASALLFAKYGAKLTLVGRNEQRLQRISDECHAASDQRPLCLKLDLTAERSCSTVITSTVAKYDRIDVLVNCAGKLLVGSLFDDNMDAFDEMININLRVPYKLTQLALPHLVKTKGNVVNLNTTKYTRVRHGFLPFTISKSGLERFTKSAAVELASEGVRVNAVGPGLTKTNILSELAMRQEDMENSFEGEWRDETRNYVQIMDPEEIAKMVFFVASDICPNLNGAEICFDGGTGLL